MAHELVPATADHAAELAQTMRQADVDEVWAATGMRPLEGLLESLGATSDPRTGLIDGEVACMCGIVSPSVLSTTGVPWLLSSNKVDSAGLSFAKGCKAYFKGYTRDFDLLVNFVDARHEQAIRWLKWLGFTIHPAEPFGPFSMDFHKIEMRK